MDFVKCMSIFAGHGDGAAESELPDGRLKDSIAEFHYGAQLLKAFATLKLARSEFTLLADDAEFELRVLTPAGMDEECFDLYPGRTVRRAGLIVFAEDMTGSGWPFAVSIGSDTAPAIFQVHSDADDSGPIDVSAIADELVALDELKPGMIEPD